MKKIRLLLTDVDGCLTDGTIYYGSNHEKIKKFNMQDGMALKLLKDNNILTGIISSDNSEATKYRAEDLKFDYIYINIKDKLSKFEEILKENNIQKEEVAYMGDDIQDLCILKQAGISVAPNNAVEEVKNIVSYITQKKGGNGAFREYAEYIIKLNGGIENESCCTSTNKA